MSDVYNEKIKKLADIIKESRNIVFFGGAGVSTESNIPDFRSATGVFSQNRNRKISPEELVSSQCFYSYPDEFFDFYKEKLIYPDAEPNKAHYALARLEQMGKLKSVVTQNVDGLHQKAGSKRVHELHGSVHRNFCTVCGKSFSLDQILAQNDLVPKCDECRSTIKPDVVLYGEALDSETINQAIKDISTADTLIIGGTSLVVYPAAGFVDLFRGKNLVLINKSSTPYDSKANLTINAPIGEVLGETMNLLD